MAQDNPASSLYHVGFWVQDIDQALHFYTQIMDFSVLSHAKRATGGERVMLGDTMGNYMEILSDSSVLDAPDALLHPVGRVEGLPHIAIRVEDTQAMKQKLQDEGYEILREAPDPSVGGYITSENGEHRMIFVRGPGNISLELFEFVKENDLFENAP